MVTIILKLLFENNVILSRGFVHISQFLPDDLNQLYLHYYQSGSGFRVLLVFLLLIAIQALFSPKDVHRFIAKLLIGSVLLFWATDKTIFIMNTEVPLNVFGLPILKIPRSIILALFFLAGGSAYFLLRQQLGQFCRKRIVWFVDASYLFLLLIYFLPLWSGELFQS